MDSIELKDNLNNSFDGPLLITQNIFNDLRGYFYETWNEEKFNHILNKKISFVQDNQSFSKKGTLRGLHYQIHPKTQGKLVRTTIGEIFDVIVDLRIQSKTFTKWAGVKLSSANKKQLWVPPGFAHGFLTLSDEALVEYKVSDFWSKEHERSLIWDDKEIDIDWPIKDGVPFLSDKDRNAPKLKVILEKGDYFL